MSCCAVVYWVIPLRLRRAGWSTSFGAPFSSERVFAGDNLRAGFSGCGGGSEAALPDATWKAHPSRSFGVDLILGEADDFGIVDSLAMENTLPKLAVSCDRALSVSQPCDLASQPST